VNEEAAFFEPKNRCLSAIKCHSSVGFQGFYRPACRSIIAARSLSQDEVSHGFVQPEITNFRPRATVNDKEFPARHVEDRSGQPIFGLAIPSFIKTQSSVNVPQGI
jgi:hypothetical protein